MSRVRSPKSIGGVVGLTLGNAPYGDNDRIAPYCDRYEPELKQATSRVVLQSLDDDQIHLKAV